MAKKLMKGNEALAEAAIFAGCRAYFCYPITPQTEVAEYLARRMPEVGGVFLQAESELAAINMLFGASGAGVRVFSSSSSPGISLMAEGISYIAAAELPIVLINIVRCGPGLGGILPSQGDYFQSTKGGGHGDYRCLVLAPSTIQEAANLMVDAFDLADKYRNPVLIVGDGMIGQMMEPVEFRESGHSEKLPPKNWATTGKKDGPKHLVKSLFLDPVALEVHNRNLKKKYNTMEKNEVRFENYMVNDECDAIIIAYGTTARICKTSIEIVAEKGLKVGLVRPITLFPFPYEAVSKAALRSGIKYVLSVEMSVGQMVEDVDRAVQGRTPVHFFGRTGGIVPSPEEVAEELVRLAD